MQDIIDVSMLSCTYRFSWEPCKCEATHISMYPFPLIYIYIYKVSQNIFHSTKPTKIVIIPTNLQKAKLPEKLTGRNRKSNPLQKGDLCVQIYIWAHICISSLMICFSTEKSELNLRARCASWYHYLRTKLKRAQAAGFSVAPEDNPDTL